MYELEKVVMVVCAGGEVVMFVYVVVYNTVSFSLEVTWICCVFK